VTSVNQQDLVRLFHTVRHLKPVQVYRRVWRPGAATPLGAIPDRRPVVRQWTPAIPRDSARIGIFRFRFLNQEREPLGWNDPFMPKLWLYNLHYFDAPEPDLMRRWIAENPAGCSNGWEPYPLSLRIVNWIKWALAGGPLDADCTASLARQAERLSRTLEYHLLGNHLFANAKALVFAGLFFECERWLRIGCETLARQVPEQVLADGGHFERSPMYHSIVLEDLLDLINLHRTYGMAEPETWVDAARRMLGWLDHMCHPDGRIAFFNDAAFGVAPEPGSIFDYARRLEVRTLHRQLGESGYMRLEDDATVLLFDAAPIGPDFQPGHAHADALSFELSRYGQRIIVNSGTSTYETGALRAFQRGTAAHSTVVVDGCDQSEVWSAFRVARRARTFDRATDGAQFVQAAHDGYHRLRPGVTHRRRIEMTRDLVKVTDELLGRGSHAVAMRFHKHPDTAGKVRIHLDGKCEHKIEPGHYYPSFNVSVPNRCVVGTWRGSLPVSFRSVVSFC
jgi:uncharacterized heparinase superfamily protein